MTWGDAPDGRRDDPLDHARLARSLRALHDAARPAPPDRRRPLRADAGEHRSAPRGLVGDLLSPRRLAAASASIGRGVATAPSISTAPPLRDRWNDPATTPDELLLWFHRLPWDYRMKSGRTLWDELVFTYTRGAEEAKGLETRWIGLRGKDRRGTRTRRYSHELRTAGGGRRGVARQVRALLRGGILPGTTAERGERGG